MWNRLLCIECIVITLIQINFYRLDFSENNNKAIDEVWYKRAVEQHYVEAQSFVFSVPFDAGDNEGDFLVTASHAIFHTDDKKSAPAAVVGFQFRHSTLYSRVKNITNNVSI